MGYVATAEIYFESVSDIGIENRIHGIGASSGGFQDQF